ncbi:MAG: hypothetical protein FWG87_10585 [Defluviitaleaceae bacterium]|nr:hypothetical protein [Defluviitaleaceae bacterium]
MNQKSPQGRQKVPLPTSLKYKLSAVTLGTQTKQKPLAQKTQKQRGRKNYRKRLEPNGQKKFDL